MAKRKRLMAFGIWPANWGLEGKRRLEALAEYYLDGEDLERELLNIRIENKESEEYARASLEIDYKYDKITENLYLKEKASFDGEPYFTVVSGSYEAANDGVGRFEFELDWNEIFVEGLVEDGWEGITDDQIVNSWFDEVCRQMISEESEDEPSSNMLPFKRTLRNKIDDDKSEYS
jgi:hypothetical protein